MSTGFETPWSPKLRAAFAPNAKHIVGRGRLPRGHAYLRTIACSDTSQLDQHTDDSMRASCAALAAARAVMSRADFAEEEKARGVRYNPAGLLFSAGPRFLAISTLRFDPMHVWWSNGVASHEIFLVLTALEIYGVTCRTPGPPGKDPTGICSSDLFLLVLICWARSVASPLVRARYASPLASRFPLAVCLETLHAICKPPVAPATTAWLLHF